jgi:hypothetical protein
MSKRPHLLATVVVQHRLIKHRNLPDEPVGSRIQIMRVFPRYRNQFFPKAAWNRWIRNVALRSGRCHRERIVRREPQHE